MSRLPHVGGDIDEWGDILNDFLLQSHTASGEIKNNVLSFDQISGINIVSPANSDILVYNSSNSSWQNSSFTPGMSGNTPQSYIELEPVKAVLIGNAWGYGPLPNYTYTLENYQDQFSHLYPAATITGAANGALVADGYTVNVGDRVAWFDNVAYQTFLEYNDWAGIYVVTTAGDGLTPFVLTRSSDTLQSRYWIAPVENSTMYGPGLSVKLVSSAQDSSAWELSLVGRGGSAQGYSVSIGTNSSAEGGGAIAYGESSHAEGSYTTTAPNAYGAHAEGNNTNATAGYSHAEGQSTLSSGFASHAEGTATIASNSSAHAEGYNTTASDYSAHAEGDNTTASGQFSHAQGSSTTASGPGSHAQGFNSTAHRVGENAESSGYFDDNTPHQVSRVTLGALSIGSSTATFINGPMDMHGNPYWFGHRDLDLTLGGLSIIRIEVAGYRAQDDTASCWTISLQASNMAGTTRLLSPPVITLVNQDAAASSWAITCVAGTGGTIALTATADSGSVKFVALCEIVEVS